MRRVSLKRKIMRSFFLVAILVLVPICVMTINIGTKASGKVLSQIVEKASITGKSIIDEVYPGQWSLNNEELCKGDKKISNSDMVSKIKKDLGFDMIFLSENKIISTSIDTKDNTIKYIDEKDKLKEEVFQQGNSVNTRLRINDEKYLSHLEPIKDQQGKIIGAWAIAIKQASIIQYFKSTGIIETVGIINGLCILCLILVIYIAYRLSSYLTCNINEASEFAKKIAIGDLTYKANGLNEKIMNRTENKDEVVELIESLNTAGDSLRGLILNIKGSAEGLTEVSGNVEASIEEINVGFEEIVNGVNEMAVSTENNASAAEETASSVQEIANNSQKVAINTESVAKDGENALKLAEQGAESVKDVVKSMNNIKNTTNEACRAIEELEEYSEKINEMVLIINAIAEQTNLLALNAAIEAARAGEHGTGFAVVADEVRKLAEESKNASGDVMAFVKNIQQKTKNASEAMEKELKLVEVGVEKSYLTSEEFNNIYDTIKNMSGSIENIADSIEQQTRISMEMANVVEEFSCNTQETAANSQKINSVVERRADSIENVRSTVDELNIMSKSLKEEIKKFKL
ncbi:methyl-accepting chemotaxis protein [Haloimpatiens massiliensis]|uniref:methyl-accepting chemotaxis protein n=1 Tax=Haloimpatiens massiliensis TaxID=1658110 RepID=UPI0015E0CFA0|nr:methyl-accepting chemotaxis protein [Haloimpatiens massiliensis]